VLPVYGELLQSMLAYDVLGFRRRPTGIAFRSAVAYVWGPQSVWRPIRPCRSADGA
jgi:hypothetical protein